MGDGLSSLCLQTVQPQQALSAQTPASLLPLDRITCYCCSPFSFLASLWHHFTPFQEGAERRKTFPKFKTLRGNQGKGEQWATSCNASPLPGHNHATPIPAEACSQPPRFSPSTNKACPTRNWAACSDLPQKCSFS